jgi:hypothetical protein
VGPGVPESLNLAQRHRGLADPHGGESQLSACSFLEGPREASQVHDIGMCWVSSLRGVDDVELISTRDRRSELDKPVLWGFR